MKVVVAGGRDFADRVGEEIRKAKFKEKGALSRDELSYWAKEQLGCIADSIYGAIGFLDE